MMSFLVHCRQMTMSDKPIATPVVLATALIAVSALAACSRAPDTAQQPPANAPTTQSAPDESKVKTFQIGAAQGMALRDGALEFPNDGKTFAIDHLPADVAALLTAAGLPSDKLSLSIQPLLVRIADRVVLFDTGAGTNMGPAGNGLPESLAAAGVDAGSITDVFISHIHGDHVGGLLNSQGTAAFPNATIHIAAPDWEFLKGMNAETAANVAISQHAALIAAIEPKIDGFSPGADILPGAVKAVEIRGHTPGHSGYLITSGASSLLYIGDAMHHHIVSVQKPDWTINFDTDAPTAEASRSELLARSAESGQRIYSVHFPFPGIGKVERRADGFVWVPE
jgi:glyoxylase-like metal-dependent hydrolase (beta-lactamase superfamily II)